MMNKPKKPLRQRDLEILGDVIRTYLEFGEPVSSRRVAQHEAHDLSSASLRNIMADLEDRGYLMQPHASSGRVPTAAGYHLFIDSLMVSEKPSSHELQLIDRHLADLGAGGDWTSATSQLLSQLTRQVGIVLAPSPRDVRLRTVEFLPLDGPKVLAVIVSMSGFIENRVFESHEVLPREELVRISNYVTEHFSGLTLAEIRDRLLLMLEDERARVDELVGRAVELAQQGFDLPAEQELLVDGAEVLLGQPELADLGRVRRLFETFAEQAKLVALLNQCIEAKRVRVFIREDCELTSELDFSLVAKSYGVGNRAVGTLGVFGPSRMEYSRVIPLVDYLSKRLSAALAVSA